MSTRHPAGRGCWGGATVVLAIAGVLTAGAFALGHSLVIQNSTVVPANAPAAVVAALDPTTTAATPSTTTQDVSAPVAATNAPAAAPRAAEETTVAKPTDPPATYENGSRVEPSNPNANQKPATDPDSLAKSGMDKDGNPVGTPPTGQPPQN